MNTRDVAKISFVILFGIGLTALYLVFRGEEVIEQPPVEKKKKTKK